MKIAFCVGGSAPASQPKRPTIKRPKSSPKAHTISAQKPIRNQRRSPHTGDPKSASTDGKKPSNLPGFSPQEKGPIQPREAQDSREGAEITWRDIRAWKIKRQRRG
ncbi:hypothetical protein L484_009450 [Morus notabilis]|uniref:Uncharacterized protein n=1 Tax=Morus notabilis TaxID=981085 RepID=W9S4L8_9ROSA|nr:hypothetical protein L484_009450 [Morus notabilis]